MNQLINSEDFHKYKLMLPPLYYMAPQVLRSKPVIQLHGSKVMPGCDQGGGPRSHDQKYRASWLPARLLSDYYQTPKVQYVNFAIFILVLVIATIFVSVRGFINF